VEIAERTRKGFEKLCATLRGTRSLLIVMQDNPDPDSIAAAAALRRIANSIEGVQCSIAYGGKIGRGENRALVGYLGLNFRRIEEVDLERFDVIALVDTQPCTGNNSLPPEVTPAIVLDHHPLREETAAAMFSDVRPKYGAVSSMLVEYLTAADITPNAPLATALLYAIRSDTRDLGPAARRADIEADEAMFALSNTRMLSAIQRGRVKRGYFRAMATCLDRARLYGDRVLVCLEDLDTPDRTGEMADLLLRREDRQWVMCYGFHEGKAWLSLRTSQTEKKAGDVMTRIVSRLGTGGGHLLSAGGQVQLEGKQKRRLRRLFRERFLRHTGGITRGQRMLPRKQ
jgi:nanoRNase/pAp phosphatase (c-di-AMP/oligoRNAs hydrolase)